MDPHFRAFSFVDRITSVQNATDVRGRYAIPSDVEEFPGALVGEAVGQLAAWAAMSALKFTHRPIAGLAGCIEFLRESSSTAQSWSSALRPHQRLKSASLAQTHSLNFLACPKKAHRIAPRSRDGDFCR